MPVIGIKQKHQRINHLNSSSFCAFIVSDKALKVIGVSIRKSMCQACHGDSPRHGPANCGRVPDAEMVAPSAKAVERPIHGLRVPMQLLPQPFDAKNDVVA